MLSIFIKLLCVLKIFVLLFLSGRFTQILLYIRLDNHVLLDSICIALCVKRRLVNHNQARNYDYVSFSDVSKNV